MCVADASTLRLKTAPGRGWAKYVAEASAFLEAEKAASMSADQSTGSLPFLSPLKASVSGCRVRATAGRKRR
jgi:hypothetical protein